MLTAALKAKAGGRSASPVLKTRCSKSRGRYVVLEGAGGALSVGTPIMHCQASAAVVADQSLASTCHACFQPLKGKALRWVVYGAVKRGLGASRGHASTLTRSALVRQVRGLHDGTLLLPVVPG